MTVQPTFDADLAYTIEARRSGSWWALTVPELPGIYSQVRRLEQAESMMRDAVSLAYNVAPESIHIVGTVPILNPDLDQLLQSTNSSRARLASLRAEVEVLSRRAAHDLAEAGIPVRDIAAAMNISFQHAAKLAKPA